MTQIEDIATITTSADSVAKRLTIVRECPCCQRLLTIEAFGVKKRNPSGRQRHCRDCLNERQRTYRSTPEGSRSNVIAWRKSTARSLIRAGRPEDAKRIYSGTDL